MKTRSSLFSSVVILSSLLAACSSDSTPSSGDASTPSTGGSGGTSGTGGAPTTGGAAGGTATGGASSGGADAGKDGGPSGPTVTVSGLVVDATNGTAATNFDITKYPVLAGVKVCDYDDASVPCVTTGSDGKYALVGVSGTGTTYLSYSKATYDPILYAVNPSGAAVTAPAILDTTIVYDNAFFAKGGLSRDATTGTVQFGATSLNAGPYSVDFGGTTLYYLPGFQATVTPAPKFGPVYISNAWQPDKSLTAAATVGWGIFGATPGDYTLNVTRVGLTCGATTTRVVAGYTTTYVGTLCTGGTTTKDGGAPDGGPDAAPDAH